MVIQIQESQQDQLVEEIIAEFERTILKPLHRSSGEKIRSDLKDELDKILEGCKGLFAMMDVSVERHNLLLEKKGYSSYSALIEAYDPEIVRPIFEDIISKEGSTHPMRILKKLTLHGKIILSLHMVISIKI